MQWRARSLLHAVRPTRTPGSSLNWPDVSGWASTSGADVTAAYRQLPHRRVRLEALQQAPTGLRLPLTTRYRKYADQHNGRPRGFATPTRKLKFTRSACWTMAILRSRSTSSPLWDRWPQLAPVQYPLILTCAKLPQFCHSQHRALPACGASCPTQRWNSIRQQPPSAGFSLGMGGDRHTARAHAARVLSDPISTRVSSTPSTAGGRAVAPRSGMIRRALRGELQCPHQPRGHRPRQRCGTASVVLVPGQ